MKLEDINEDEMQREIERIQKKVLKVIAKEKVVDAYVISALQNIIVSFFLANENLTADDAIQGLDQMCSYSKMMVMTAKKLEDQKV